MEIAIPEGAVFTPPPAFGGLSLESEAENHFVDYIKAKDCTLKVDALPASVYFSLWNVAERLPHRQSSRISIANAERTVLPVGLRVIREIVDQFPHIAERTQQAIMTRPLIELVEMPEINFTVNVGPVHKSGKSNPNPTIFANNAWEVSEVHSIANTLNMPVQTITKLCLIAGLAQSMDTTWVRADWKRGFIEEVRRFRNKLAAANRN